MHSKLQSTPRPPVISQITWSMTKQQVGKDCVCVMMMMMMMMYFRAHECIVGNWTAWDGWRWVYALLTPLTDLFLSSCAGLTKSVTPNAFPAVDSSRAHFSSDSNNNNLMQEEEVSFAWHAIKNGRDQQLAKFLLVRVQVNADYLGRSTHFRTLCHLNKSWFSQVQTRPSTIFLDNVPSTVL